MELSIAEAQKESVDLGQYLGTVLELLMKSERTLALEETSRLGNKGNGYYERMLQLGEGRLRVQIPRDRFGHFRPYVLDLVEQDSRRYSALALSLYAKGMSQRDIQEVLGEFCDARMSPSKLSEIVQEFEPHRITWQSRPLAPYYAAVIIDAVRIPVRRETVSNEACFLVMGVFPSGKRDILGLYLFPEEGAHAWREVFADLQARGVERCEMLISDELKGILDAGAEYFPSAQHQICLVHRQRNLLNHIRADDKAAFLADFKHVFQVGSLGNSFEEICRRAHSFVEKWKKQCPLVAKVFTEERLRTYTAFLHLPVEVQRMFYTTNWIERLNRHIRKVTRKGGAFPSPDSLMNAIFFGLSHMEKTYSRHIPACLQYLVPHLQNKYQNTTFLTTSDTIF